MPIQRSRRAPPPPPRLPQIGHHRTDCCAVRHTTLTTQATVQCTGSLYMYSRLVSSLESRRSRRVAEPSRADLRECCALTSETRAPRNSIRRLRSLAHTSACALRLRPPRRPAPVAFALPLLSVRPSPRLVSFCAQRVRNSSTRRTGALLCSPLLYSAAE